VLLPLENFELNARFGGVASTSVVIPAKSGIHGLIAFQALRNSGMLERARLQAVKLESLDFMS
jgi:hypothetical protein